MLVISREFPSEKVPTHCTAVPRTELSKFGMLMSWPMLKPCKYKTVQIQQQ